MKIEQRICVLVAFELVWSLLTFCTAVIICFVATVNVAVLVCGHFGLHQIAKPQMLQ